MDVQLNYEEKQIPGFPKYVVTSTGDVISLQNGKRTKKTLRVCRSGYLKVRLHNNGKESTVSVHRLVAGAFIPNPDNLPEVNHKNGNKKDNRATNLEWVTRSENALHSYRTLNRVSAVKGRHFDHRAKLTPIEVQIIRQTDIPANKLGDFLGVSQATVSNVRNRNTYKYLP